MFFSGVFSSFPTHITLIIIITNSRFALCSHRGAVGVLEDEAGEALV